MTTIHTRVIGIGQPLAGDDQAGIAVARALAAQTLPAGVAVHEITDPARLVELLGGIQQAILIDAIVMDAAPGEVRVLTPEELAACQRAPLSSHGLDVPGAIQLSRTLAREAWDSDIQIIAICIDRPNGYTDTLSNPVAAGVFRAAVMIAGLLGNDRCVHRARG